MPQALDFLINNDLPKPELLWVENHFSGNDAGQLNDIELEKNFYVDVPRHPRYKDTERNSGGNLK